MRSFAWVLLSLTFGCSSERPTPQASLLGGTRGQALASAGDLASSRVDFGAAVLPSGTVLVAGGYDGGDALATMDVWDPVSAVWSATSSLTVKRRGLTASTLSSGKVILLGGDSASTGELFDPATGDHTPLADDGALSNHTATVLASDDVVVVGGGTVTTARQARVWVAASNSWSDAAMAVPRGRHSAVHLADNRVLVAGGLSGTSYLSSVEFYDPTTSAWKSSGELSLARADMAAVVMTDSRVLLVGGTDGKASTVVDIWDPSLGVGSATTSLATARSSAAAVNLGTGRVLVLGGQNETGVLSTTEVFDVTSGKWAPGPNLSGPRHSFAAVAVSGGRVLVIGGHDGTKELKSTEVFGGQPAGAACVIDEECLLGGCKGGLCGDPPDAGPGDTDPGAPPTIGGTFTSCTKPSDCPSGFCVEGLCCNKACTGRCESCALPASPGLCAIEPFGTDKKAACGGGGGCVGTCDGKGACMAATTGTQCAPVKCVGPATGTGAAVCPSKGAACPTPKTFDCTPFACEPALGACRSTCNTSANCAPGFACDVSSHNCVSAAGDAGSDGCAFGVGEARVSAFVLALGGLGALFRRRRR